MSDNLIEVALCDLKRSHDNVRRTDRDADLAELVASIEHHGLLQSLTVRPSPGANGNATYEVIAGGRRLAALRRLAKKGKIARNLPVPCLLIEGEGSVELSLAENTQRAPLHAADQFEAFHRLHKAGDSAEEIATRFGISPVLVTKRLKLAAVSPVLMAAFKADDLGLEQLMAFAITDDREAQERLWSERRDLCHNAYAIRRALTESLVQGTDRRARFVGIEAYEAAGGRVIRDLFSQEDAGYFEDGELLTRLAHERLEEEAMAVRQEGWGWVECHIELDYGVLARFRRVHPTRTALSEEEQTRLDGLAASYDALVSELDEDPASDELGKINAIEAEMDALLARQETWESDRKAQAGAIITLDHAGRAHIERGLLKSNGKVVDDTSSRPTRTKADGEVPDVVRMNLSAHLTAALQASVAMDADLALDLLVARLVRTVLFDGYGQGALSIAVTCVDPSRGQEDVGVSKAMEALAARHAELAALLPEQEALFSWLREADDTVKRKLLAYCLARTLTALQTGQAGLLPSHEEEISWLARTLELDMGAWWRPTRDAFLLRLSKGQMLHAVREALTPGAAENIARLKKDAMASRAEELLAKTDWLPAPLRVGREGEVQAVA